MLSEGWNPLIWWWQLYAKNLCTYLVKNHKCTIDLFTRSFIWDDNKKYSHNQILMDWKWKIFRIWPVTRFFNLLWRLGWLIKVTFVLYKKAKKEKYDIIHAHALLPGLPAKIVGKLCKIPVVYTVHGTMHMDAKKKWLLYRWEKFFVTKIKYNLEISVSHNILEYPNRNKNVVVIYPGIDPKKFADSHGVKKYPWTNLLFVGRLDRQKGLEYLLEWISFIDKRLLAEKHFHLNIVGEGNLKEKLIHLIDEYKINEFVTMKWRLSDYELIKEYQSNQIFILPSLAEWQPVVVFEAFLAKMPVIATDVWDNKHFIKNHENWFLLPAWNAAAIKETIEKVLDMTTSDYEKMWEHGYAITKDYSRDNVVQKIYEKYTSLLHKK